MNKLLTIVVPVYKVEPYINKCLDSCVLKDDKLMSQLEVIIVNDGTPDRSAEMSREYVKRYPQTFRQIDKENGGHGSAWNVGLKEATGKYLRFLDSDDWLTNLDKLMEKLAETDADLVFTQMTKYHASTDEYELENIQDTYGVCKDLINLDFSINSYMHLLDFWHTTYKSDILRYKTDLFMEHTMYDDGILFVLPAVKGKTYIAYDFVLYNYYIGRDGQSLSQEKSPKSVRARYKQLQYMWSFWEQHKNEVNAKLNMEMKIIIVRFANFLFGDFHVLPFKDSKTYSQQCANYMDSITLTSYGKVYKRYKKYPFPIFYIMEKIRNSNLYRVIIKR